MNLTSLVSNNNFNDRYFWISKKKLLSLIEEAFDKGVTSSFDLSEEIIQDILVKSKPNKSGFKLFSIILLQKIPIGCRIIHSLAGDGEVVKSGVSFLDRFVDFGQENFKFWSYPILYIKGSHKGKERF